jgi:Tfp pilus assembly protein PilO
MSSIEKKKLSELLLVTLALTFVILVGFERLVMMPQEQAFAYEKAIGETRMRMQKAGPLATRKRQGYDQLMAGVKKVTERIITMDRTDRVADYIRETAVEHGVKVPAIGFDPASGAKDGYLVPVELSLQIVGGYPQVARFIEKLEAGWMERTGLPMTLRSLRVAAVKNGLGVEANLSSTILLGKEIPWESHHGTTPG